MIKRPKQVEKSQKNYLSNERYQDYSEQQFKNIYDYLDEQEEEISKKSNYSTTETVIGEWLGKPLYRKVIQLQSCDFGSGEATQPIAVTIAHNISNVDYMVNWNCKWKRTSNGQFRDFPNSSPSNDAWHGHLIITDTNLFFELGATLVNVLRTDSELIYVVLEYTKI